MIFAVKTDVGLLRSENQDSCETFEYKDAVFALVADGMGGYSGGKIASEAARKVAVELIKKEYDEHMSTASLTELMKSCFCAANAEILERAYREGLEGMGTTMVLAAVRNGSVLVLNVGDSRAYIAESGELKQLTKDQSYVQSLVDAGKISAEEAESHPQRNIIMQAVGTAERVRPDAYEAECREGYILLCSDGLSGKVSEEKMKRIIYTDEAVDKKAQMLIDEANSAGGEDNITVSLIQI